MTMTVDGDYLYAGEGMSLAVYHLDSDTGCPSRVSSICLFGTVGEIAVREHLAYVAAGEAGFCVVDVSDPAAMYVVKRMEWYGEARNVKLGDSVAYVSFAKPSEAIKGIVVIFDLSQPASPRPFAMHNLPDEGGVMSLDDQTLYVAWGRHYESGGCDRLDVTEPDRPLLVGSTEIGLEVLGIHVVNNTLYLLVEFGVLVAFNVDDLENWAGILYVGEPTGMAASGTMAYVISNSRYECLSIIDLQNPASMTSLGEYIPEDRSMSVATNNGMAYIGQLGGGIAVVDARTPSSPVLTCLSGLVGYIEDIEVVDNRAYVVRECGTSWYWKKDQNHEKDACIIGAIDIVDTSDPSSLLWQGRYATCVALEDSYPCGYDVAADRGLACAAWRLWNGSTYSGGLEIVDVNTPTSPQRVGTWLPENGIPVCVSQAGATAYVSTAHGTGSARLFVLDLSDAASPSVLGSCKLVGSDFLFAKSELSDGILYIIHGGSEYYYYYIDVVDVRNPSKPLSINHIDFWHRVRDMAATGSALYVVGDYVGAFLLDFSSPAWTIVRKQIGDDGSIGSPTSVSVEFDRLYLNGRDRLVRASAATPTAPIILDVGSALASSPRLEVSDCLIHTADNRNGLQIYDDGRRPLTVSTRGHGTTDPAPGKRPYDTGTQVTITAAPEPGYKLDHWEGDVGAAKADNPLVVTVDAKKSVTAVFTEITYTLTTAKQGFGYTNPAPGVHAFVHDTPVTVTATPEQGWRFDHWEGDFGNDVSANPIIVTMTGDKSVTAFFVPTSYVLTIATSGQGSITPEAGVHEVTAGSEVSITAQPATGWQFDHWEGDIGDDATSNPLAVTMDQARTVTAVFVQITHTLSIDTQGAGNTTPEPGEHTYAYGSEVTLVAQPALGWQFDHWEGDISGDGTANPIAVTLDQDRNLTAVFVEITFTLSLSVQGEGTISPEPGQYAHAYGTQVALTATPAEGWRFDRWESAIAKANTDNPITITMNHDQTITAVFVEDTAGCTGGSGSTSDAALIGFAALALWLASLFRAVPISTTPKG